MDALYELRQGADNAEEAMAYRTAENHANQCHQLSNQEMRDKLIPLFQRLAARA